MDAPSMVVLSRWSLLGLARGCGSMIVPWGAVGPTTAVGVYKPPHAPERGMGRPAYKHTL
eukprot:scaffold8215_cov116-Isochrysis_galbana.AAC.2